MKTLDNSPLRPAVAQLVFKVALAIVPQASRDWLEDMRLEASFIKPDTARLRWALGAFVTAFRFRLATLSMSRPQTFALASAAMVAVVALFVIVPQSGLRLTPVLEQLEGAPVLDDVQLEPPASVKMPPEAEAASPLPQESSARERSQDGDATALLEAQAPAPSELPEAEAELEADEAVSSLNQKAEALSLPAATSDTEVDTLDFADASIRPDDQEFAISTFIPTAVTELQTGPVMLEVRSGVWLELYEGPAAHRRLVFKGQARTGESFELSLPFYIQTDNAGAIEVIVGGHNPESLGPKGVALGRLFRLPH